MSAALRQNDKLHLGENKFFSHFDDLPVIIVKQIKTLCEIWQTIGQ